MNLEINHRTVKFNNRILQLKMITAVSKVQAVRPLKFKWRTIAIATLFLVAGIFCLLWHRYLGPCLFVTVSACVFVAYATKQNLKPRNYWILHVETASGSSNLLASSDQAVIDDAVRGISAAIKASEAHHDVVVINDSTIVNDAVIQQGPELNNSDLSRRWDTSVQRPEPWPPPPAKRSQGDP